jgi:hypothetical protein
MHSYTSSHQITMVKWPPSVTQRNLLCFAVYLAIHAYPAVQLVKKQPCMETSDRALRQWFTQVANRSSCFCYLLHAGFFLGLLFDPEGEMFLRNDGWLSPDYTVLTVFLWEPNLQLKLCLLRTFENCNIISFAEFFTKCWLFIWNTTGTLPDLHIHLFSFEKHTVLCSNTAQIFKTSVSSC